MLSKDHLEALDWEFGIDIHVHLTEFWSVSKLNNQMQLANRNSWLQSKALHLYFVLWIWYMYMLK